MTTKKMVRVSLFTALTAISAFINIPLGPISITLQSFFVILSGLVLGPKLGALSQLIYLFLGLVGLPIFTGFTGGLQAVFRPSFGFIVGFIFASYFSAICHAMLIRKNKYNIWLASLIGNIIIYLFGLPYMYFALNILGGMDLGLGYILKFGLLVFLPGDILKILILATVGKRILAPNK